MQLIEIAHAGKRHHHAREARGESDCITAAVQVVEHLFRRIRKIYEVTALDRLHDQNGLVQFAANLAAFAALYRQIVVIQIIELNLNNLDLRIFRQDLFENVRAIVERNAQVAYLVLFFQFKRRFIGAALLEALEFIGVLRVHQAIIKVVRAARIELLLEQRADLKK